MGTRAGVLEVVREAVRKRMYRFFTASSATYSPPVIATRSEHSSFPGTIVYICCAVVEDWKGVASLLAFRVGDFIVKFLPRRRNDFQDICNHRWGQFLGLSAMLSEWLARPGQVKHFVRVSQRNLEIGFTIHDAPAPIQHHYSTQQAVKVWERNQS